MKTKAIHMPHFHMPHLSMGRWPEVLSMILFVAMAFALVATFLATLRI